jgi:hypothetical protein
MNRGIMNLNTISIGVVTITLVLVHAIPSSATTFASTQLCWRSDGSNNLFQYCSNSSGNPDTAMTLTKVTPNPDGVSPDQIFNGSAYAFASPDTWKFSLSLGTNDYRRDMYIWSEHYGPGDNTVVATTGAAWANSTDEITVTGGTGVYSLNYIFSVDGTLSSSDPSLFSPQFCASLFMPQGVGTATSYCLNFGDSSPTTFDLNYANLPFGGPIDPSLFIGTFGLIFPIYSADVASIGSNRFSGNLDAEFGSTVHLQSLLVTDANGKPIPGVTVSSQSGFNYPLDPSNVANVPEPSGFSSIAAALFAIVAHFRRRASVPQ